MTLTTGIYADSKVQTRPYLSPLSNGGITTPDPPFPTQCILLCRVRGPFNAGGTIAAQRPGAAERAFVIDRLLTGALRTTFSPDGVAAGTSSTQSNLIPVSGGDEEFALAMETGTVRRARLWQRLAGTWTPVGNWETATAMTVYDSTAVLRLGGYGGSGASTPWDGRIYYAELRTGGDPEPPTTAVNLPSLPDSWLAAPVAENLNITGDIEVVIRASLAVIETVSHSWVAKAGTSLPNRSWSLGYYNQRIRINFAVVSDPSTWLQYQPNVAQTIDVVRWYKFTRNATTGEIVVWLATDQTTEPTTAWSVLGSTTALAAGPLHNVATPIQTSGNWAHAFGQLRRLIVRDGINGRTVLDIDDRMIPNDAVTTFKARTGQTITVVGDVLDPVTQPTTIWRFDASEYPGSGTSYVDPRGRTWTLDNAGGIVP